MRIELPSGHTVLADDADMELLLPYSWHLTGTPGVSRLYASARIRGDGWPYRRIKMHRLIMNAPEGMVVHHINNNGLDNRRCNLEVTTQRRNTAGGSPASRREMMKKFDTTDYGMFHVKISHEEANNWLMDAAAELEEVNSAIDEAASHAADSGKAYVLIEISAMRRGER